MFVLVKADYSKKLGWVLDTDDGVTEKYTFDDLIKFSQSEVPIYWVTYVSDNFRASLGETFYKGYMFQVHTPLTAICASVEGGTTLKLVSKDRKHHAKARYVGLRGLRDTIYYIEVDGEEYAVQCDRNLCINYRGKLIEFDSAIVLN